MDMILKIVLVVIIMAVVILTGVLSLVVTQHYRKNSKKAKLDELLSLYEPDQIKLLENEMQIVYNAASKNQKLRSEYLRIDSMNSKMKLMAKVIGPELFGLKSSASKITYVEFKKRYILLLKKIHAFNKITNDFKNFISLVTAQFDFLRTEFATYQKILREVLDLYKKKRIILSSMSKVIDEKAASLKIIEKRFYDATKISESKNAVNVLNVYIENITLLTEAVDMFPSLIVHLDTDIPKNIKTLNKLYNGIKAELGISFEHISYSKLIKTISQQFKDAKTLMKEMKAKEASIVIATIYKSVKFIENMINIEVRAKNLYLVNYNPSIDEVTRAMSDFVTLREKINYEKNKGTKFDQLINSKFVDIKQSADILFGLIKEHSEISVNREMPFSTKVSKLKLLLNKTALFIQETNELSTMIWEVEAENKKTKNKLKQIKDAMNKVIAEAREKSVPMSEQNRVIANELTEEINAEFDNLKDENSRVNQDKISSIMIKAVEFYKIVGGDIIVAEMATNMIKQVSGDRALDENLNATMSAVERYYENGDYDGALTHITNYISERRN